MKDLTYEGPATLIVDGREWPIDMRIGIDDEHWGDNERPVKLRRWYADFDCQGPYPVPGMAMVRLPDGRTGRGALTQLSGDSGRHDVWTGRIVGNGPPPTESPAP